MTLCPEPRPREPLKDLRGAALVIGVVFGALVIAPVLDLLNDAFGFVGAPGAGPKALPAPQAGLISALVKGVLGGSLNWNLVGLGLAIGAVIIVIDETLARRSPRHRLPHWPWAWGSTCRCRSPR
jgi:putative OPT family oligopeptide transporter